MQLATLPSESFIDNLCPADLNLNADNKKICSANAIPRGHWQVLSPEITMYIVPVYQLYPGCQRSINARRSRTNRQSITGDAGDTALPPSSSMVGSYLDTNQTNKLDPTLMTVKHLTFLSSTHTRANKAQHQLCLHQAQRDHRGGFGHACTPSWRKLYATKNVGSLGLDNAMEEEGASLKKNGCTSTVSVVQGAHTINLTHRDGQDTTTVPSPSLYSPAPPSALPVEQTLVFPWYSNEVEDALEAGYHSINQRPPLAVSNAVPTQALSPWLNFSINVDASGQTDILEGVTEWDKEVRFLALPHNLPSAQSMNNHYSVYDSALRNTRIRVPECSGEHAPATCQQLPSSDIALDLLSSTTNRKAEHKF
jgi:hypothetical protein